MVEKRRKISNSAADDEDESGQQSFGTEVGCQVSTTDSETQTDSQFLCKNDIWNIIVKKRKPEASRLFFALKRQGDIFDTRFFEK